MKHISKMTVKELKAYCKKHKISGYSKLRKAQILSLIEKQGNKKKVLNRSRKQKRKSRKSRKKSRKQKRKSRKSRKKSRKPKRKSRKSKKKSRKPKRKSRKVKKSRQVLGSEISEINRQIKKLNDQIKERKNTQKGVQKQLDKDLKIKDPGLRVQQDIAYNEALIIDIQQDIDKLEQKKKDIEPILEIYQNISKKIKMKNKDIRTIQQLMYNISKVKNTELKKKLMDMLRTYKMKEFVDDTVLVKRTNIILSRIRNGKYDDDLENGKKMAMRYINQIKSKPLQRKKITDMENDIYSRKT